MCLLFISRFVYGIVICNLWVIFVFFCKDLLKVDDVILKVFVVLECSIVGWIVVMLVLVLVIRVGVKVENCVDFVFGVDFDSMV